MKTIKSCLSSLFTVAMIAFAALSACAEEACHVDVLFAFDTAAKAYLDNTRKLSVDDYVAQQIAKMNEVLENSGLSDEFTFRCAGTCELGFEATQTDPSKELTRCTLESATAGTGGWKALHDRRDEVGADIVSVLIDTGDAYGHAGDGNSLTDLSNAAGFSESAYSVVSIRSTFECYALLHEVGHNLGAGHALETSAANQSAPYSHGYYLTGTDGITYYTVMAYQKNGLSTTAAPVFSSPDVTYKGVKCGTAASNDNVRVILQTYQAAANWRQAIGGVDAVEPMMTVNWDQHSPFNDLTPVVNGSRTPCGCAATAAVQMFKHYAWPVRTGEVYTGDAGLYAGSVRSAFPIRFDGHNDFQWDKMKDSASDNTSEGNFAAARATLWCDAMAGMDFRAGDSSAKIDAIAENASYWYEKGKSTYYSDGDAFWLAITNALARSELVQFTFTTHQVVADGFKVEGGILYVHLNYGHANSETRWYAKSEIAGLVPNYVWTGLVPKKTVQLSPMAKKTAGGTLAMRWAKPARYAADMTNYTYTAYYPGDTAGDYQLPATDVAADRGGAYYMNVVSGIRAGSTLTYTAKSYHTRGMKVELQGRFDAGEWVTLATPELSTDETYYDKDLGKEVSGWKSVSGTINLGDYAGKAGEFRIKASRVLRSQTVEFITTTADGEIRFEDLTLNDVLKPNSTMPLTFSFGGTVASLPAGAVGKVNAFVLTPKIAGGIASEPVSTMVVAAGTSVPDQPTFVSVAGVSSGLTDGFKRDCAIGKSVLLVKVNDTTTGVEAWSSHPALVADDRIVVDDVGSDTYAVTVDATGVSAGSRIILTLEAKDALGNRAYKDLQLTFVESGVEQEELCAQWKGDDLADGCTKMGMTLRMNGNSAANGVVTLTQPIFVDTGLSADSANGGKELTVVVTLSGVNASAAGTFLAFKSSARANSVGLAMDATGWLSGIANGDVEWKTWRDFYAYPADGGRHTLAYAYVSTANGTNGSSGYRGSKVALDGEVIGTSAALVYGNEMISRVAIGGGNGNVSWTLSGAQVTSIAVYSRALSEAELKELTAVPSVFGAACLHDWTFTNRTERTSSKGIVAAAGSQKTTGMTGDANAHYENAVGEVYTALKAYVRPYANVTVSGGQSVAYYGTAAAKANTILFSVGRYGSSVFLATSPDGDGVVLARTTSQGDSVAASTLETLTGVSDPNGKPHLYVLELSSDMTSVKVWVDGSLAATHDFGAAISLSSGVQISGMYSGAPTNWKREDDEATCTSAANCLRIYDHALIAQERELLVEEFDRLWAKDLVCAFAYEPKVNAAPTGWLTDFSGEKFESTGVFRAGPGGEPVSEVLTGRHPYADMPSKTNYTMAIYADLSQVPRNLTGRYLVMMGSINRGINQGVMMTSEGKVRLVQANKTTVQCDTVETAEALGAGYHLIVWTQSKTAGGTLYVDGERVGNDPTMTSGTSTGFQLGSLHGGAWNKNAYAAAVGLAVAGVYGWDGVMSEKQLAALAQEYPATGGGCSLQTVPAAISGTLKLVDGDSITAGAHSCGIEIAAGATVDVLSKGTMQHGAVLIGGTSLTLGDGAAVTLNGETCEYEIGKTALTYASAVARVGDTNYGTIAAALVAAGDGGKIRLLVDYEVVADEIAAAAATLTAVDGENNVYTVALTFVEGCTLRFSEIMPKPSDKPYAITTQEGYDKNGLESGWVEVENTGDAWADLKDYRFMRSNRGKAANQASYGNFPSALVPPHGRYTFYTSERYSNSASKADSAWAEGTFDGKPIFYGDMLIWGDKINPKKYPLVTLVYAPEGGDETVADSVVIPSDTPEGYSIVVGAADPDSYTRRWLTSVPTINAPNGDTAGMVALGPNVGPLYGVKHSVDEFVATPPAVPGQAYSVSLHVNPVYGGNTNDAIAGVTLVYRTKLGKGVSGSVPMTKTGKDKGGDIYSAEIPADAIPAEAGQLIQWKTEITDAAGNVWTSPSFNNPDDGYKWYGTITEPGTLNSAALPTWHMFVDDDSKSQMDKDADNQTLANNARVAIYDASTSNYYDYVRIDLRGNTSAHFSKKSHGLRFAKAHPLTMRDIVAGKDVKEIRKSSLIGEPADPSLMRQMIAFWLWDRMGNHVPFDFPVRCNLNGEFYQLAFHSERFTDELIEDVYKLDKYGYSYKNVGTLKSGGTTTAGGIEKKTPDDGNESDLTVLQNELRAKIVAAQQVSSDVNGGETGLNNAALTKFVVQKFDLPAWLNYLASARITQEMDDVWANVSIYYDNPEMKQGTRGTDTWMPLGYDFNLSFGQYYHDSSVNIGTLMSDQDWFKSHPFYGGNRVRCYSTVNNTGAINNGNDGFEAVWQSAKFRRLYLRRLRTLMDQELKEPGVDEQEVPFMAKMRSLAELMRADSVLDRERWPHASSSTGIIDSWGSNWPASIDDGIQDIWDNYVVPRRRHLYVTHSVTNTARAVGYGTALNAGIPEAQRPTAELKAGFSAEYDAERGAVAIFNANAEAVDLSGWKLSGPLSMTLPSGTVVDSNDFVYVVADRRAYVAAIGDEIVDQVIVGNAELDGEAMDIVLKDAAGETVVEPLVLSDQELYLRLWGFCGAPDGGDSDAGEFIIFTNLNQEAELDAAGANIWIHKTGEVADKCHFDLPNGSVIAPGGFLRLEQTWKKITDGDVNIYLTASNGVRIYEIEGLSQKKELKVQETGYFAVYDFETGKWGRMLITDAPGYVPPPSVEPGGEAPTYDDGEAATNAAAKATVVRPEAVLAVTNDLGEAVVSAEAYAALFTVTPKESAPGQWTLQAELKPDVAEDVQQALDEATSSDTLVDSMVGDEPAARITTLPGLFYGLAVSDSLEALSGAEIPTADWVMGDGGECTLKSSVGTSAASGFFNVRMRILPPTE